MDKMVKMATLAFFLIGSGFMTAEIKPEEPTTQEQKRRIVKEKLKNCVLAGIIGLGTGTIEGIADSVLVKSLKGNFLIIRLFGMIATWTTENTIRNELIKDFENDSQPAWHAAWMASWIGYCATRLLMNS